MYISMYLYTYIYVYRYTALQFPTVKSQGCIMLLYCILYMYMYSCHSFPSPYYELLEGIEGVYMVQAEAERKIQTEVESFLFHS